MLDTKTDIRMQVLASDTAIMVLALYDSQNDKFMLLPVGDDDPRIDAEIKRAVDDVGAVPVGYLAFKPLEDGQFLIEDERFPDLGKRCSEKADAIVDRAKQIFA